MGKDETETDVKSLAVTERDEGWSWISYPAERGQRASHALETNAGIWPVDPVDRDGLDNVLATSGDVTAVLVYTIDIRGTPRRSLGAATSVSACHRGWSSFERNSTKSQRSSKTRFRERTTPSRSLSIPTSEKKPSSSTNRPAPCSCRKR